MRGAIFVVLLLAGCAASSPVFDRAFGQATRDALAAQIADVGAAERNAGQVVFGLDGPAAVEAVNRYQKSGAEPPAPQNVFAIGLGGEAAGQK